MPRVKPLTVRPKWEEDMLKEMAAAYVMTGLTVKEICRRGGIKYETFRRHMKEPSMMRFGEYHAFIETCEKIRG